MGRFDLPNDTQSHVIDQLIGKNWGELEILEQAGQLLFPESLYKRSKSGKFEEIKVLVKVPRHPELVKARVEARQIAIEDGLDLKEDRDLIEDWETICTLSHAIMSAKNPTDRWEPFPRAIAESYDKPSLMQIWAKIDALTHIVDPAPDSISGNEMFALMSAIAKERNLSPLFVYGSGAQTIFVVGMVDQLLNLLELKSSSEPSEPSTPESSPLSDSPSS
jgi:hypothetical protein